MLGRLILTLLQAAIGWFGGPIIASFVPIAGAWGLFVYAVIFAVIVFLTGVLSAVVFKDVDSPSSGRLTASLVLALVAAAVATFGPQFIPSFPGHAVAHRGLVLAAAILGYFMRR